MAIFYTKTKSEILSQIMNSLSRNAGITNTSPGSIARAFADAVSDQIGDLYTILKYNMDQTMISTASGRNLDLIGELYSVKRKQVTETLAADRNLANVIFSIAKSYSRTITIPKGTLVYNDIATEANLQFPFSLANDVSIEMGSKRSYGQVVPSFSGQSFTAAVGTLTRTNFIPPPGVVLSVQNIKEIHNRIDYESDENYRRRIIRSVKLYSAGTVEAIRLASLAVKGVRDVRIREATYGIGSCDVIIVPESVSTTPVIERFVREQLVDYRPVGINLVVSMATRVPVGAVVNVILSSGVPESSGNSIATQVAYFMKRYLNSLTIGDNLNIETMRGQAFMASDLISEVSFSSITVGGIEIPQENYSLSSDRAYMAAGLVAVYPAIMGAGKY
jgi:uncharacterized phage protein gp47/JayE